MFTIQSWAPSGRIPLVHAHLLRQTNDFDLACDVTPDKIARSKTFLTVEKTGREGHWIGSRRQHEDERLARIAAMEGPGCTCNQNTGESQETPKN